MDTFPVKVLSRVIMVTTSGLIAEVIINSWDKEEKKFNFENLDTSQFLTVVGVSVAGGLMWELGASGFNMFLEAAHKRAQYNISKRIDYETAEGINPDSYRVISDY